MSIFWHFIGIDQNTLPEMPDLPEEQQQQVVVTTDRQCCKHKRGCATIIYAPYQMFVSELDSHLARVHSIIRYFHNNM